MASKAAHKRQKTQKQKKKREHNISEANTTKTKNKKRQRNRRIAGKHRAQVEEEARNRKRVKRSVRQLPAGIATQAMKLLEIVAAAVALEKLWPQRMEVMRSGGC